MEETLQVTNVLSDPTRFNIYQFLIQTQQPVTVLDISERFDIHPNVARLHLSKLENIRLLASDFHRTGKGGRPSKVYQLSDHVVELTFPYRDYKLMSSIMMDTFMELGDVGKQALYRIGKKYGQQVIEQDLQVNIDELTIDEKINILRSAGTMLGMYPNFEYNKDKQEVIFQITNCPFKEIASKNHTVICGMHHSFLKGMLAVLFTDGVNLIEQENMFKGCNHCSYIAKV